jgi:FKBP-type peptidyl-prolyl cis-trans isomerase FklB
MKKLMFFAVSCFTAFTLVLPLSSVAQTSKVVLKTDMDSLSYAFGVQMTEGLDQYLVQSGITGASKEAFFKSLVEGSKIDKNDSIAKARILGQQIGMQITSAMLPGANKNIFGSDSTQTLDKTRFIAGFLAGAQNNPLLMQKEAIQPFIQEKTSAIQAKVNEPLKLKNQAFLDANNKKDGVITLPSGLQYKVEKEGTGIKPVAGDTVIVNYVGTNINGEKFDGNESVKFPLSNLIKGWTEGIQLMSSGAKYAFYIPYDLAYGEQGRPPQIEPYATLVFDIELLDVLPKGN